MKILHMLVALAVAVPLAAQQPDRAKQPAPPTDREKMGPHHGMMPGGMRGMHEMMGPIMRGMAYAPDHLLIKKDRLGLTDQQTTRLTAIRNTAKTGHDAAASDAKTHRDALRKVLQADAPDTAALRQHFVAAHAAMGNAHLIMLRAAAQAKAVLTDAQRGRVEGWVDAMEQMGHRKRMRGTRPDSGHRGFVPSP